MSALLVEIKTNITVAQVAGETSLTLSQLANFERRYQDIIEAGLVVILCTVIVCVCTKLV